MIALLLWCASALAATPVDSLLVDAPVLRAAYPHAHFAGAPGASGWLEARVTTVLLAHALDHLIYMDMPPPPGALLPDPTDPGGPQGAGVNGPPGPPPGGAGAPLGPPGPPPGSPSEIGRAHV